MSDAAQGRGIHDEADEECVREGQNERHGRLARNRAAATTAGSGSSHGKGHAREVGLGIQETNEAGQTQSGCQDASAVATLKTLPYGDQTHKKALPSRRLHAL